jgi:hypothetical protein
VRATVYIPVVVRSGEGSHRLLHVHADRAGSLQGREFTDPAGDANKAGFSALQYRLRARLRDFGLYEPATAALKAVRALGTPLSRAAWYQRLRPGRREQWLERLDIDIANPVPGITETGSATLGLALLMLMQGAGSRTRRVIATGSLDVGQDGRRRGDGIRVVPVGHLYEKLQLVMGLGRQSTPLLFFTPPTALDGAGNAVPLSPAHPLLGPEIRALEALNIHLRPVASLADAAR